MDLETEENLAPKRHRPNQSSASGSGGSGDGGGDMIPLDRISSLPESVISHILSFLPTNSAVATGFLSKTWSLRWTHITSLDFDDRFWPNLERPDPEIRGAAVPPMNFTEFVNSVFTNHAGSIHKLRLYWQSHNLRSVYLHMWLKAAIARNFRVLDLAVVTGQSIETISQTDEDYSFDLPAGLYSCRTLEILKLRGPIRIKLPHLVSLPKLVVLELICIRFECDESVVKLISACPKLENLVIEKFHFHNDLSVCKVASPSLKHLEVCFHEGCQCAHCNLKIVIDTPSLQNLVLDSAFVSEVTCVQRAMPINELEIDVVCATHRLWGDGVAGLVQACVGVKVLKLQEMAMMALARGTSPLPETFGRLTDLVLEFPRTHWKNVMDLIDRCNGLQVLDISVAASDLIEEEDELLESFGGSYWRRPARVPQCFSSSLMYVNFKAFDGVDDEMAMLKFLLDHGLLIERVNLSWSFYSQIDDAQKLDVVYKVSMLSRASATCKISFS